jgi:hypothetical protein
MTASFRPATPGDASAIVGLFEEAGLLHPNIEPQHLEWKYWQPRADWPAPRSFVLTDGGELMAHVAIIPGSCAGLTRRIKVGHMIDWAASRRAPMAGVALLNLIGQQAFAVLAVGGAAQTLEILPRVGFQAVGVVTGYARSLHPWRLRRRKGAAYWMLPARVVRSIAWTLTAPAARRTEWRVHRLAADEVSRITPVFPVPKRGIAVLERSVDLFHYILSCPIVPMELFGVEMADRVRGYYLLATVPGQVRIADCWIDSEEPADWCALILCAVEQAKRDPQAAEVVIWASDPSLAQTLEACGFHERWKTPILVRPVGELLVPQGPLRVHMLDADAAYLRGDRKEFWS